MDRNNRFKEAIGKCREIKDCLKPGLTALGRESVVVKVSDTSRLDGSVDIDNAVKMIYPNDSRWDYVIGFSSNAYFIEVHPADTKNVDEMVGKVKWLKNWLTKEASELKKLHKCGSFHWVPSGRVKILRTSPQFRKIAVNNLLITKQLLLK